MNLWEVSRSTPKYTRTEPLASSKRWWRTHFRKENRPYQRHQKIARNFLARQEFLGTDEAKKYAQAYGRNWNATAIAKSGEIEGFPGNPGKPPAGRKPAKTRVNLPNRRDSR